MESFYGGKLGYSFVVKPNPNDMSNGQRRGWWTSMAQIEEAAQTGILQFGDYAIITQPNGVANDDHGKLVRISEFNGLEVVAKIGNPSALYSLALISNPGDGTEYNHPVDIEFLDDANSKVATNVRGFYEMVYLKADGSVLKDGNGVPVRVPYDELSASQQTEARDRAIGITFNFPRPVFDCDPPQVHQYGISSETNVELNRQTLTTNGTTKDVPFYYQVNPILPSSIVAYTQNDLLIASTTSASEDELNQRNLENIKIGDYWMVIEDIDEDRQSVRQIIKSNELGASGDFGEITIQRTQNTNQSQTNTDSIHASAYTYTISWTNSNALKDIGAGQKISIFLKMGTDTVDLNNAVIKAEKSGKRYIGYDSGNTIITDSSLGWDREGIIVGRSGKKNITYLKVADNVDWNIEYSNGTTWKLVPNETNQPDEMQGTFAVVYSENE